MKLSYEIPRAKLDELIAAARPWGVTVEEIWEEPEGARFIGTFEGHTIRLFPKNDSNLALYFTVAHLYGHMVQLTRITKAIERSMSLVGQIGKPLTHEDVQCIYDHELEAAAIGRTLIATTGNVSPQLDQQYSRLFFADFHYLVNFIETGQAGVALFEHYWRREPVPWRAIESDGRPLVDLSKHIGTKGSAVVV